MYVCVGGSSRDAGLRAAGCAAAVLPLPDDVRSCDGSMVPLPSNKIKDIKASIDIRRYSICR